MNDDIMELAAALDRGSVPPDIRTLLEETTTVFRKGETVVEETSGATSVYGYDPQEDAPEGLVMVDVHFITVGVKLPIPEGGAERLAGYLATFPDPEALRGGPSYITLGGFIGSQEYAFRFMALGKALGLWEIITPETMGMEGAAADRAAGAGFVLMTGWPTR
jgi:hypothetical protein